MPEFTLEDIRDWKEYPVTRWFTTEIIALRVAAGDKFDNAVRQDEIGRAHEYIGMKDAYGIALGLADEKIEELEDELRS